MQLLFYASHDDKNGKRLLAAVREALPQQRIDVFRRLPALRELLCTIVEPDSIVVLSAFDQTELKRMQALRELLSEIFVILVVPDNKKGTIRLAHLLLARFISLKEDSFADLQEVLKKMVSTPH